MKFAYADPPYIGQAKKHYGKLGGEEVDHGELLARMTQDYDGFALSCSSPSLQQILSLPDCPKDIRVGAWVKPFAIFKPNVNPAYTWEPVLYWGSRPYTRTDATVRDWVSVNITLRKGLAGAKPEMFCLWILQLLNVQEGDTLDDVFPGTGIMSVVLEKYFRKLA